MWIVRLALRRPYTVATLCLAILLMGALSVRSMNVDVFPSVDIPVVVVIWNYPGLSADDMERRVTFLSERAFSTTVSGITRIESQSISGISVLRVYFEPTADIGGAIAQISATSAAASRVMPPGIQPPAVLRFNASNVPVAQMTLSGDGVSEQQLFDYSLNVLRLRLFTIPGLATPAPYGGKQRQIVVDIDPARVAAKGLSPQDVVQALLQQNVIIPAGSARLGRTDYDVLLNSSPDTVPDFNQLPVKVVGGATVYLRDVANVYDGFANQQNIVRVNGKRATYLAILKKENASTLTVVDTTKEMIPALKAVAPDGMEIKIDFDQSVFVRGAVYGVLREGLIAAILVALMTLAFIGSWRSTVVVCISIPLAITVGVIGLKLTGQTLNLMTLGGLALAIGMLVDDATVEVENINRNRLMGKSLVKAILDGAQQIATPALAATLTICIVFFPVVLLTGPARYLFIPLALSVVISMLASYILSRTLVPTLSHLLLAKESLELHGHPARGHSGHEHATEGGQRPSFWVRVNTSRERAFERFQDAYSSVLRVVLDRRRFVIWGSSLVAVLSGVLLTIVGLDFFPSVDAGIMRMHFRAPPGLRIEETERMVQKVEEEVRAIVPPAELETVNDNIGLPLSYNLGFVPSDNVGGSDAEILVALKRDHHETAGYARRVRERINAEFPSSTLYFQSADIISQVLNFGLSAPVDVQVEGSDVTKTLPVAIKLEEELKKIPGAEDVRIAQQFNHPALRVNVDRTRTAQLGLSERDVASSLLTSLSSSSLVAPNFWVNPQNKVNYIVAVQTPLTKVESVEDLLITPVTAGAGAINAAQSGAPGTAVTPFTPGPAGQVSSTLVGNLASLEPTVSRSVVNHYTVQPVLDVQCNVEGRDLGSVARDIDRAIANLKDLPRGVNVRVRGQIETMYSSFTSLGLGLIVAVLLVYLLLVVLFQSWLDPFLIMVAVPGAMVGILWMLIFTHTTLNVQSFMGAIMAVGIATSNSILLVNFANEVRLEQDVDAIRAAFLAGRTRLRPVIMTALAMILGMLPMALGLGEGGEQNAPLGRAVIGGLIMATVVTLFIVPCAYAILRKDKPRLDELDRRIDEGEHESTDTARGAGSVAERGVPT